MGGIETDHNNQVQEMHQTTVGVDNRLLFGLYKRVPKIEPGNTTTVCKYAWLNMTEGMNGLEKA